MNDGSFAQQAMAGSPVKKPATERRWYEQYLPFVVRGTEMQIEWLAQAVRRGRLSPAEIAPYISLVLAENVGGQEEVLRRLLNGLDRVVLAGLLGAAEIHDLPLLFSMLASPTVELALIALRKEPPPYEKAPEHLVHKVLYAVYGVKPELLEAAVEALRGSGAYPAHFEAAYGRFVEIIEDQKLLSVLFPKAAR